MLDIAARISAFEVLGRFISQYDEERNDEDLQKLNSFFLEGFRHTINEAGLYNNWFTKDNVQFALQQWSSALAHENLQKWMGKYPSGHFENDGTKSIAIIMAGNIPMVGFHDFLSVLICGHKVLVKPSSDDDKLIPFLAQILVAIDKRFAQKINFAVGQIRDFDAIIATGSNNSARYFDYYFSKYPSVIRKNRTSVAVISGDETEGELTRLGSDVFRYFGLGCRNVSKLFLPEGYDTDKIFQAFYPYKEVIHNNKYGNNFDYNRAIYLLDKLPFLENGFVILRENESLHAPAAVLHWESYGSLESLNTKLDELQDDLQCIVAQTGKIKNSLSMGSTQAPALWDYADKVDTIQFLHSV